MKILLALLSCILISECASADVANGANVFHEYCSKCHALPDIRATEPPSYMYQYILAFGATPAEVEDVKEYVDAVRGADNATD